MCNSCSFRFKFGNLPVGVQLLQLLTFLHTSFAMCVQKNSILHGDVHPALIKVVGHYSVT